MSTRLIFERNIRHFSSLLDSTRDPLRARALRDLLVSENRKFEAYVAALPPVHRDRPARSR